MDRILDIENNKRKYRSKRIYKVGMTYWAFENKKLFEKCHIIAYRLSAKLANSNNIFIGTVKLNKSYMKQVENEVRKHINDNSVKILYRVTVKYQDTNKIPIGLLYYKH